MFTLGSRHYGTDTRASGLLLGALLALVWVPRNHVPVQQTSTHWRIEAMGITALVALLGMYVGFSEQHPFLSGRGQYGMPNLEYGLGMMRNQLPLDSFSIQRTYSVDDRMVFGHIGGFGGFRTALWYAPASDVLITLSFNQAQADPNDVATAALDRVLVSLGR